MFDTQDSVLLRASWTETVSNCESSLQFVGSCIKFPIIKKKKLKKIWLWWHILLYMKLKFVWETYGQME